MSQKINVSFQINGAAKSFETYPMTRLLDLLREDAGLTGTKEGCGEGECGACSILMNGDLVNACLIPAIQAEGASITTIEGVASGEQLANIQRIFLEDGGVQCGICTPGMVLAAIYLMKQNPHPSQEQIQEGLAGNLCRCTGYTKIFDSVARACEKAGVLR